MSLTAPPPCVRCPVCQAADPKTCASYQPSILHYECRDCGRDHLVPANSHPLAGWPEMPCPTPGCGSTMTLRRTRHYG